MSAPISRKHAAMTVTVFALIVTVWALIGADRSLACTIEPCSSDPVVNCDYYSGSALGGQPCTEDEGLAVGAATGTAGDGVDNVLSNVAGSLSGYGPQGTPGVAGVPTSHVGSGYGLVTGQDFASSKACTTVDSTGRSAPSLGQPCGSNNQYGCWVVDIALHRRYTSAIYWTWITKMNWCGYSMGKITSRTYNDHDGLDMGYQCGLTKEVRTPVEKIDDGHWQQHSNFTFKCHAGGLDHESHATEGAHYYNNGYSRRIQSGGDS